MTPASAPFGRRFAALVIDSLLCAGVAALFTQPNPPGFASALVMLVAYSFFTGVFRQTPGMRLLGLACVNDGSGAAIGVPKAILRTVLLQLLVPAVFMDRRGRGWHDRAAGSIVVRVTPEANNDVDAAEQPSAAHAER